MKKNYENLSISVVSFSDEDIIITSSESNTLAGKYAEEAQSDVTMDFMEIFFGE